MQVGALDAARGRGWDRLVDEHRDAGFFQRRDWLELLGGVYPGFAPRHVTVEVGGALSGVAPAWLLWNPLTGRRLTSQPFNFYGGPLATDAGSLAALVDGLESAARESGARILDVRTTEPLPAELVRRHGMEEGGQYLRTVVPLEGGDPRARYARRFRERLVALERDAVAHGPRVLPLAGPDQVDALHAIMVGAYARRHATLAQPRRLLRALFARLGPGGVVRGLGLFDGERLLAGIVLGRHGGTVSYLFGASCAEAERTSPLARLLDHALGEAGRAGAVAFDLGITSRRHAGLRQFKTRFGAEEMPLYFYRRALFGHLGAPPDYHGSLEVLRPVVSRMPRTALAAASAVAAGWLG